MSLRTPPALAFLIACALAAGCGGDAPPAPPNVLLITVDTLRPDRLACYGGDEIVGTAICGLASKGIRFVWALSPAPSTAPAVASVLTSRYPSGHGVSELAHTLLPDRAVTLAEAFRDAGYSTAAFVSNPVLHRRRNLDQGFAIYDQRMTRAERNRPGFREREAAATSAEALAWAKVTEAPWFLWVHYQDPHGPYDPPGAVPPPGPPTGGELPVLRDHSGYRGIPAYQALPGLTSFQSYAERYVDEIRYLDVQVGLLVAGLDALGEPPLVVLTADHAEAFGEDDHYFSHGHSLGLDQIRVPLLIRPPSPAAALVSTTPVSTIDVAPTLLRAAGLDVPPSFRGRPLPLDAVAEAAADDSRVLFAEHRLRAAAIAGGVYYARDHAELTVPTPDPVTGGMLQPLPPRTARLGVEGALPGYEAGDGPATEPLETALSRFLERSERPAPEAAAAPDFETRKALEALGYLE